MNARIVSTGLLILISAFTISVDAQVNSGSDGSDGAFNPTVSTNINMASRPSGIYQFESINIPAGVEVQFFANAENRPVVWLVQSKCTISGVVDVSGLSPGGSAAAVGGNGGPGGFGGGNGGNRGHKGEGPGAGVVAVYATLGWNFNGNNWEVVSQPPVGGATVYGNEFIVPLVGGSGGEGVGYDLGNGSISSGGGGGGGGGAILIASSSTIELNGRIESSGGSGASWSGAIGSFGIAGGGSGGAI